jgi:hypothetical protein
MYLFVSAHLDLDWYLSDVDYADDQDLSGLGDPDVVHGELTAPVVPIAADEFRCGGCFLIRHRSQLARRRDGAPICRDCD